MVWGFYFFAGERRSLGKKLKRIRGDAEREREVAEKSESLGASDDLFTSRNCMRGMNVALCTCQTVGSNVRACGRARECVHVCVCVCLRRKRKRELSSPKLRAYRCLELHRSPPASTGSKQLLSERDRPPWRDWEGANGQKTRKRLFHSLVCPSGSPHNVSFEDPEE